MIQLNRLKAEIRDMNLAIMALKATGGWKYREAIPWPDEKVRRYGETVPFTFRLMLLRALAGRELATKYGKHGELEALVNAMAGDSGAVPKLPGGYENMSGISEEMRANWEEMNVGFTQRADGPWARSAMNNRQKIAHIWNTYGNRDVATLRHKGPAVVTASGPSLLAAAPALRAFKGPIYGAAQTMAWFRDNDVPLTYAVVADEQPNIPANLMDSRNKMRDTIVVTHPCMHPLVLELWPEDKLYFLLLRAPSLAIDGCLEILYGTIADRPGINTHIRHGGNYVNIAITLAARAGCSPIYVVGYDLAYGKDHTRWDKEGPPPADAIEKDGAKTDTQMVAYEAMTMGILNKHPEWDVRNVWAGGLLQGMKRATLEEVANAGI